MHTVSEHTRIDAWQAGLIVRDLPQTFHHAIDVYLKDSNAYANTYFARYFEWQGICRERWFHQYIDPQFLKDDGVFVTKQAYQNYVQETFPFDRIDCSLNTHQVKRCSFFLIFKFSSKGQVVSTGHQEIVFVSHTRKIAALPEHVLEKLRQFELR